MKCAICKKDDAQRNDELCKTCAELAESAIADALETASNGMTGAADFRWTMLAFGWSIVPSRTKVKVDG